MPNGNGSQSSWGGGANQRPPDLDVLLRQARDWFRQLLPSGGSRGVIVLAVLAWSVLRRMDGLLHGAE